MWSVGVCRGLLRSSRVCRSLLVSAEACWGQKVCRGLQRSAGLGSDILVSRGQQWPAQVYRVLLESAGGLLGFTRVCRGSLPSAEVCRVYKNLLRLSEVCMNLEVVC